jgi:hypothetical protein
VSRKKKHVVGWPTLTDGTYADGCLCLSGVVDFVQTNVVAQAAAALVGQDAAITDVINTVRFIHAAPFAAPKSSVFFLSASIRPWL